MVTVVAVARAAREATQEAARAVVKRVALLVVTRAATWVAMWAEGKRAAATAAEVTGCRPRSASR